MTSVQTDLTLQCKKSVRFPESEKMNSKTDLALGQRESKKLHTALKLNCLVWEMVVWDSCQSRIVFHDFF